MAVDSALLYGDFSLCTSVTATETASAPLSLLSAADPLSVMASAFSSSPAGTAGA